MPLYFPTSPHSQTLSKSCLYTVISASSSAILFSIYLQSNFLPSPSLLWSCPYSCHFSFQTLLDLSAIFASWPLLPPRENLSLCCGLSSHRKEAPELRLTDFKQLPPSTWCHLSAPHDTWIHVCQISCQPELHHRPPLGKGETQKRQRPSSGYNVLI